MGNIKIRNLTAATSADIISGDMVPVALDNDAGLARVTRRATFSQIVSGGSGVLAADPNSPFVFNNTTTEQVFKGGLSVPGNITLSGNLNLTGAISGNATGYFDSLYITGAATSSSPGPWHQVTTDWSGASPATLAQVSQFQAWHTDNDPYLADIGLALNPYVGPKILELTEEWDLTVTGLLLAPSGNFTESLTISGNSVLTGAGGAGAGGKWLDGLSAGDIYYAGGNVGIGTNDPDKKLEIFNGGLKFGTNTAGLNEFELFPTDEGSNGLAVYDRTNATYRMLISNDGNVGIGTTTPSHLLHVTGNGANYAGYFQNLSNDRYAGGGVLAYCPNAHPERYVGAFVGLDSTAEINNGLYIKGDGRVGIGTHRPSGSLEVMQPVTGHGTVTVFVGFTDRVVGTDTTFLSTFKVGDTITFENNSVTATISSIASDTLLNVPPTSATTNSRYSLVDDGSLTPLPRFCVLGNGNIGVGTITPTAPLDVVSTGGGVIMPRMTTAQMNAIPAPTNGEMIYNTSSGRFAGHEAAGWQPLVSASSRPILFDGTNGLNVIEIMNLSAGTVTPLTLDFALTMGTTNTVPDGLGGTKTVDLSSVPVTARTITVFASIDSSASMHCYWKYKHPGGSAYVFYIRSHHPAGTTNSNNSAVPLDANGRIDFRFNATSSFAVDALDLHIVGYEA